MKQLVSKMTRLYIACQWALALPPSYKKEVADHLADHHLVDLILWWLVAMLWPI
jgi:hypothetical protein